MIWTTVKDKVSILVTDLLGAKGISRLLYNSLYYPKTVEGYPKNICCRDIYGNKNPVASFRLQWQELLQLRDLSAVATKVRNFGVAGRV